MGAAKEKKINRAILLSFRTENCEEDEGGKSRMEEKTYPTTGCLTAALLFYLGFLHRYESYKYTSLYRGRL